MASAVLSIFGAILGGISGGRPIMPAQMAWNSTIDPVELQVNCPANTNTTVSIPSGAKACLVSMPAGTTSRVWLKGLTTADAGQQIWPPGTGDPLAPLFMPIPTGNPASFTLFVSNGDPAVNGVKVLFW